MTAVVPAASLHLSSASAVGSCQCASCSSSHSLQLWVQASRTSRKIGLTTTVSIVDSAPAVGCTHKPAGLGVEW
jgi:hypothetical protein